MSQTKNDCTIITVSFNTSELMDKTLRLAEEAARYCETIIGNKVHIIAVDNASSDGSADMIAKKHPSVQLIRSQENIGFGRANNLAMRKSHTPFLLLLNSDAFMEKDTLVKLLKYMESHSDRQALCCKLTFLDGSFQPGGGYLPTPLVTLQWLFGIDSMPVIKRFVRPFYQFNPGFYSHERTIEWCSGAFVLIREDVFKKTQGFDEKIFLYMEDVEWCQRIRDAGYKIWYTPNISVVHVAGASSKRIMRKENLERTNNGIRYFHKKHFPKTLGIINAGIATGMFMRMCFYYLSGKPQQASMYRALL